MNDVITILIQIFLLIGLGLVVRWRNILPRDQTVSIFNQAVINLTLPATVFLGLMNIGEFSWELVKIPIIAMIVICVSGALAAWVAAYLRLRRATAGAVVVTSMCGSTGMRRSVCVAASGPSSGTRSCSAARCTSFTRTLLMMSARGGAGSRTSI